ncbi:MAG: hypothetical protein ACRCV0_06645 [Brevinema sp.]
MINRKTTRQEFKRSIPDVLNLFETEVQPLGSRGRQKRIEEARRDFWYFFKHYLPHYSEGKSPNFHTEIIELLENSEACRTALAAPRGFAKSTIVSFAYVIWCVLREKYKFIVLISATDDLAEDLADFIRLEFTDNQRILEDFGSLLHGIGAAGDFTVHKTRILARGRKQAVRGFRSREHRPDLIICDDIEKDNEAVSPAVVNSTLETITRGLIPSLSPKGKFVLVGTILRTRSAVGTIILSEEEPWNLWSRKIYRAIETTGEGGERSLWEDRFPLEFLHQQCAIMGRSAFNAEYQNMPSDEDSAMFTESMIVDNRSGSKTSPMVLFIDPSVDGIKKNDYKAAVLVSKQDENFCIEGSVLIQGSDHKFFDELCDLYKKHQDRILGTYCEANSFQIYFMRDLDRFAQSLGIHLRLSSIKNTLKKEHRISQLIPLFETGRITFDPEFRKSKEGKILIDQLLYFPSTKMHDDAPDALAGAVKVLESKTQTGSFTVLPKIKKAFRKIRF